MAEKIFFSKFGSLTKPCYAKGGEKGQKSISAIVHNHSYTNTHMYKQTIMAKRRKYYRQNWFPSTNLKQSYLIFPILITSKNEFNY